MIWFFGVVAGLFILDALRLRARAAAIAVLEPASDARLDPNTVAASPVDAVVIGCAPGVDLPEPVAIDTRRHLVQHGLEVVELIPADLPASNALGLLQMFDPARYRLDRFAQGVTGMHAYVTTSDVLERAGGAQTGVLGFLRVATSLKRYACRTTDAVIVPGLRAGVDDPKVRLSVLRELLGGSFWVAMAAHPVLFAFIAWALWVEPAVGAALLVSYHLQPVIVFAGQRIVPRDLWLFAALRVPLEMWRWVETLACSQRPEPVANRIEERRPVYDELLADGLERFFEPRRSDCPLCGDARLSLHIELPDQFQFKPGRFRLERCAGCEHIFQNPRLSIDGLNFYYKDFYDGLGEESLEGIFGWSDEPYLARARMLEGRAAPQRWLDVGGGHGHFCCAARDVWPQARFDGLDMSDSIDEALRRRWVDHAYRGLFPEVAHEHAGGYDVVSMSHYLEHTREPRDELLAAHTVLESGGHLLIEVPDPASRFGAWFRRFWLPWFQPQHQHFISVENLDKLFAETGFTAVEWHRGEAHQTVDLLFAAMIAASLLARKPNLPWRPVPSLPRRAWHLVVWTIATPIIVVCWRLDRLLAPLTRKAGRSNTYRVLARKVDPS